MPGETRRKTILVGGFIIWSAILWMLSYIVYTHGILASDLPNTDMVISWYVVFWHDVSCAGVSI